MLTPSINSSSLDIAELTPPGPESISVVHELALRMIRPTYLQKYDHGNFTTHLEAELAAADSAEKRFRIIDASRRKMLALVAAHFKLDLNNLPRLSEEMEKAPTIITEINETRPFPGTRIATVLSGAGTGISIALIAFRAAFGKTREKKGLVPLILGFSIAKAVAGLNLLLTQKNADLLTAPSYSNQSLDFFSYTPQSPETKLMFLSILYEYVMEKEALSLAKPANISSQITTIETTLQERLCALRFIEKLREVHDEKVSDYFQSFFETAIYASLSTLELMLATL